MVQRLTAACDTLRACAGRFTELNYREQAAEARVEAARCLRSAAGLTRSLSHFISSVSSVPFVALQSFV